MEKRPLGQAGPPYPEYPRSAGKSARGVRGAGSFGNDGLNRAVITDTEKAKTYHNRWLELNLFCPRKVSPLAVIFAASA